MNTVKTETIVIRPTPKNEPWTGCVNSVNYRIERGVPVEVPAEVAELIRQSETAKAQSLNGLRRFLSRDGARL